MAASLLAASGCSSCSSSPHNTISIDRLQIADESLAAAPDLGLGSAAFRHRVEEALKTQGLQVGHHGGVAAGFRMRAEVEFARFGQMECPDGGLAEAQTVGVLLELDPVGSDHGERIAVPASSVGATKVHPEPDARAASFLHALTDALDASAATAIRTALARGLPTPELEASLQSPDAGVREAAADVLVERKDRAAIPVLISELQHPDSEVAFKAIGELVELKATEAVPRLIDLTTSRDPSQPNDPHLQIQVVYALGSIGGDEAEAFLYTMGAGHPDPAVRRAAVEATSELHAGAAKPAAPPGSLSPHLPAHAP